VSFIFFTFSLFFIYFPYSLFFSSFSSYSCQHSLFLFCIFSVWFRSHSFPVSRKQFGKVARKELWLVSSRNFDWFLLELLSYRNKYLWPKPHQKELCRRQEGEKHKMERMKKIYKRWWSSLCVRSNCVSCFRRFSLKRNLNIFGHASSDVIQIYTRVFVMFYRRFTGSYTLFRNCSSISFQIYKIRSINYRISHGLVFLNLILSYFCSSENCSGIEFCF
jgi:hypothetical protein